MAIKEVNFLTPLHIATKRDYLARMNADKPECMRVAKKYGKDYWDGDRKYGYGGYHYDERWKPVAEAMVKHYDLKLHSSVLDIGCGKGSLIKEIASVTESWDAVDISKYAVNNTFLSCLPEIGECKWLPFDSEEFYLVYSINVFHNLNYSDLKQAIKEMMRVSRDKRYICVESYRNEEELCNLQCWALTAKSFYDTNDWKEILTDNGYSGDLELIYFT